MRILLIGAKGQLARELLRCLPPDEVVAASHDLLEICDKNSVEACVTHIRPDCIINTASYNRVDDCEEQPETAISVNSVGVYYLARAARRAGATLVHFSTNYVFDGTKPTAYVETDPATPLSVYGMSKLAGEWAVQQYCEKHFVLRSSGLYGLAGSRSKGGNFVETMIRRAKEENPIRVVNDQIVTPTSARDLAEKSTFLIRTAEYGLYHMTNAGQCSWYDFAVEILRQSGLSTELRPVTSEEFRAPARRPAYSVLDNCAFRRCGFQDFRPWQEALSEYLSERQKDSG